MTLVRWATENDLEFIHFVMNHPAVFKGINPFDDTPWKLDSLDGVHAGVSEGGVFLGKMYFQDTMETHLAFLPESRGIVAFRCGLEAIDMVFTQTMAWECTGRIPNENKGANSIIKEFGYKELYKNSTTSFYGLTWKDWVIFGQNDLAVWGNKIFPEFVKTPTDARIFGMLVKCLRGGFRLKAVDAYERMSQQMKMPKLHIEFINGSALLEIGSKKFDLYELEGTINETEVSQ